MQIIKVTVRTKDDVTTFKIDNKIIGTIKFSNNKPGIWVWERDGNIPGQFGFVHRFTAALEALTDCVDEYFRNVGVYVTFI